MWVWILLPCGNVCNKAQSNLWYLVSFAGKKQSLNIKTMTKYLAQMVARITLAKRQRNTVYVQQKHLVRKISGEGCTNVSFQFLAKRQEQTSCSCFHGTERGVLYRYIKPSASPLFKKMCYSIYLWQLFILSCFPDWLQTQMFQWKL